jgi:hypothetical protein
MKLPIFIQTFLLSFSLTHTHTHTHTHSLKFSGFVEQDNPHGESASRFPAKTHMVETPICLTLTLKKFPPTIYSQTPM